MLLFKGEPLGFNGRLPLYLSLKPSTATVLLWLQHLSFTNGGSSMVLEDESQQKSPCPKSPSQT